ncbi:MAG: hypothetical protein A3E25_17730 [Burkholderiales bacterium RIFCSPHIGHO2_12_FULL_69_20]|nr:MAG: hypothetical protein A3E25_17730 [Burkholderiales bacterium RIFCSPHIGHO2_12_FULL_69_20]
MSKKKTSKALRPLAWHAMALAVAALSWAAAGRAAEHLPEPPPRLDLGVPPAVLAEVPPPPPADQPESLAGLLARVLPRDAQVRTATALWQAAQQRRLQARSRLGPSLYLSATAGQGVETEFGRVIDRRTDRAEAGLRWNLYNSGNDQAELNASERDVAATEQDLRRAREDSSERLAETYVSLLYVQDQLPAAAERLSTVRRLVAQVQRQNEAGKASDADATQAAASLLDAEIVYEQLLADHASARAKLAAQAGTEVRNVQPVMLAAVPASALQAGVPGLVTAARLRAEAARARVRPVPALLAPRIDLEMRHRLSDRTLPVLTTESQHNWQVTARWEFPVLGESIARRNEGQRRAEAAEADADRVAQGVQADLQALAARIAIAERAVTQLDKQIAQYDLLVRAGESQFEAGRRSVQQLIGLRDSRFNIAQRRAEQANRLLAARMRQLALTGNLLPALGLGPGSSSD